VIIQDAKTNEVLMLGIRTVRRGRRRLKPGGPRSVPVPEAALVKGETSVMFRRSKKSILTVMAMPFCSRSSRSEGCVPHGVSELLSSSIRKRAVARRGRKSVDPKEVYGT